MTTGERKERRGFASMSPEKQREIASKGGRAAHEKGTAHEWTADEARNAGRKGGQVSRGGRGRLIVPSDAAHAQCYALPKARRPTVPNDRFDRDDVLEATNNGKTRSRGLCDGARRGGERSRTVRVFRDIHGAEYDRHPDSVLVDRHGGGDATGDDDVLRRHWSVVCADRRGPRAQEVVGERLSPRHQLDAGLHATSPTSPARSPSASGTAPRSSDRSSSTPASTATCGRSSSPIRPSAASSIAIPRVNRYWTGDNIGDFYVGAKFNLLSEFRQKPAAVAVRGMIKLPTGDDDAGRQHRQDRLLGRPDRQQGSDEAGRSLRLWRLRMARQPGRLRHARAARSAGAPASASRRATGCA